ncbi:MAG: ABC transporter permease [Chloroflexota bacterium]|nr:MAG: ABC transporter permease [Chloroflexota bacterium]
MNFYARFYRTQFRVTFATQIQYRVSLMIWLIGLVLEPVIYLVVWSSVAHSRGGAVGGYSTSDFAAYFIVMLVVNHATFTWIMWGFDQRIQLGILSPLLLRPIHLVFVDIADNITYKVITLPIVLLAAVLLSIAFHPSIHPPLWAIPAFALALALAFCMRFAVEWTLSLLAFWTTRANAMNQMYTLALLFLSGQAAPLSLFPRAVGIAGSVLPFRWMVSFPVETLLGRVSPHDALAGFGAQIAWLGIGILSLRALWTVGVRRYSAVGA